MPFVSTGKFRITCSSGRLLLILTCALVWNIVILVRLTSFAGVPKSSLARYSTFWSTLVYICYLVGIDVEFSSSNQSLLRRRESNSTISSAVVFIERFESYLLSSIGFPVKFWRIGSHVLPVCILPTSVFPPQFFEMGCFLFRGSLKFGMRRFLLYRGRSHNLLLDTISRQA